MKKAKREVSKETFFTLYLLAGVPASSKYFCVWLVKETSHFFIFLNPIKYGFLPAPTRIGRQCSLGSVYGEGRASGPQRRWCYCCQVFSPRPLWSARKYSSSPVCLSLVLGLCWKSQAGASAPSIPRHGAIPRPWKFTPSSFKSLTPSSKTKYTIYCFTTYPRYSDWLDLGKRPENLYF